MQRARARRRLTRREIKEDKLLILYSRAAMYLQENLWLIVGAVAVVVIAVASVYIYRGWHARQTERGQIQVAQLAQLVRGTQYDEAISKADAIISRFVGQPDRMARLYKADALRAKGEYARAKPLYKEVLDGGDDEVHSFHALKGFADCLGAERQYERAGTLLREWADNHDKSGLAPHALLEAAINFEMAHRYADARDALQKIMDDYEGAQVVGRARQRLKLMEGALAAMQ